jgi:RHS repeat-associated protein
MIARDAAGRIAAITYAAGKTVTYTRNSRGLVSQISDWANGSVSFVYDADARVVSATRANGVVTQFTYDADSRLTAIVETSGVQALASFTFQRDALGRVVSQTQALPQGASPSAGQTSFTFDPNEQIVGDVYDTLGRITGGAGAAYTWNLASELTGYTGGGSMVACTYDAFGQRISRGTQNYVLNYAMDPAVVATLQSGGADQFYYVYAPDGTLLYAIEAATGAHRYYHFDAIGSTTFLTNDAGNVTDSYGITPYGESVTVNGSTPNPFTWLGRWGVMQEGSTGLFYMRLRYYDSASARFLSRDPAAQLDAQAIDPYQYVGGDPLSTIDPTGASGSVRITTFPQGWGPDYPGFQSSIFKYLPIYPTAQSHVAGDGLRLNLLGSNSIRTSLQYQDEHWTWKDEEPFLHGHLPRSWLIPYLEKSAELREPVDPLGTTGAAAQNMANIGKVTFIMPPSFQTAGAPDDEVASVVRNIRFSDWNFTAPSANGIGAPLTGLDSSGKAEAFKRAQMRLVFSEPQSWPSYSPGFTATPITPVGKEVNPYSPMTFH